MRKRFAGFVMILALCLGGAFPVRAETGLESFSVHHGDPESNRIAITMDDVNEPEWVWKSVELCREFGITMTFFPNGRNISEEDGGRWRDVVASGCEIASHGYDHTALKNVDSRRQMFWLLGKHQQVLDQALGYHYQIRWYRPPYGNVNGPNGTNHYQTLQQFGYDHAVMWSVSQTDPDKAFGDVKNGSILLFHARRKDYLCLVNLIPRLLEAGYDPVTVSELFGFDPPETGGELYVYNKEDYLK